MRQEGKHRALRSWMFVPGNKQRFLDKCVELPVDAVILDLEDGVPPEHKALARDQIAAALAAGRIPAAKFVRLNEVGSPWFEGDLDTVLHPSLEGLCLPKVESVAELDELAQRLSAWAETNGLAQGSLPVVAAIESARGLLAAPEIARAPSVTGLMLGTEDLALDLGLSVRREEEARELVYARSTLVVAARQAGVLVIDGVYPDYQDLDGLREDAGQARRLGFDGKTLFHPGQIEEINRLFSPTQEELAHAKEVVDAFEEATRRGEGAVAVGGQLVDLPIVRRAQRLLDIADNA